jgi:hypothetical protein
MAAIATLMNRDTLLLLAPRGTSLSRNLRAGRR